MKKEIKDADIFSESEEKVLKILGKKKLTIKELADEFYKRTKAPIYSNNAMTSVVHRINKKVKYHKLPWFINGMGVGRGGKTVWRDKNARSHRAS